MLSEPNNEDLQKLKADLVEVIQLTEDLQAASTRRTDDATTSNSANSASASNSASGASGVSGRARFNRSDQVTVRVIEEDPNVPDTRCTPAWAVGQRALATWSNNKKYSPFFVIYCSPTNKPVALLYWGWGQWTF